jgi:hypothetical protein
VGSIKVVAADDDHRHPVAPGIIDRHRGVLQADGAVAQRDQRLAGDLEVAVRHADRRFLVRAGEVFRHLVAAVVDQRLVDGAEAGGTVRGQYLMSSVLITSTMKSEPATPPIRGSSFGVAVSAAATCILGGSADGRRGGSAFGKVAGVAPFATGGVTAVAAPATATPARNLRRFTSGRGSFRAMELSLDGQARPPLRATPADSTC